MKVYAILIYSEEGVELLPHYFNTYKKALDEVKKMYPDWDDRYNEDGTPDIYTINKVDVKEGHKIGESTDPNPNITELYIERGIHIYIHKLLVKPKSASGGYSRRRHMKRNTNNSRKNRI
jgi:hypothetical protein